MTKQTKPKAAKPSIPTTARKPLTGFFRQRTEKEKAAANEKFFFEVFGISSEPPSTHSERVIRAAVSDVEASR